MRHAGVVGGTMADLRLALIVARRELRGGLKGFAVFLACLVLGVATIATVRTVADGVLDALHRDARVLLGGDVWIRNLYQPVTAAQRERLRAGGRISESVEMRAMARPVDGDNATLVELKAVDSAYPLLGRLTLADGDTTPLPVLLASRQGRWGAIVDAGLLQRLGVAVGDPVKLGDAVVEIRGVIEREPDRAGGGGFILGPRVMIAEAGLATTGLLRPGSMVSWTYRVALPPGHDVAGWRAAVAAGDPDRGWHIRDDSEATPQLQRFVDRLAQFLTLVGLTALLVGGVGIGNAVQAWLEGRLRTIATLKCLGAPRRVVFVSNLAQVLVLAALGIVIGLALGVALPLAVISAFGALLPVETQAGIYPGALVLAAGYGLLTALSFSLWPLGWAQEIPPAALFRTRIDPVSKRPRAGFIAGALLAALALVGLAVFSSPDHILSLWFVLGAMGTLVLFRLAGVAATRLARRMGRPRRATFRLALANIHRPANPTATIVVSLGLGLTVLVAIALIEGNFDRALRDTIPDQAPAFFFVDIQPDQLDPLRTAIAAIPGAQPLRAVPNLRGRIAIVKGRPAEQAVVDSGHAWLLQGDRGVTYAAAPPDHAHIISGAWWPADYQGPPLVSIYQEIAQAFGIGVGDEIGINILGRVITARVASVRAIDFKTMGINFTLVFSPGVLDGAPQTFLATVTATAAAEPAIQHLVARRFGNITVVGVRDALDSVNAMLGRIGMAVRIIAGVTLLAGALVLAGAIAAGHRQRVYDAVVLKVVGATRRQILEIFVIEYGLLGGITAMISALLGTLAGWAVMTQIMEWDWTFLPLAVLSTAVICTLTTVIGGFIGTWQALGQPAASVLRNE
ncbi:MAG: FtsX-like permease family protein [Azospirillaceae bacterium]|nr:FtsX-like permease family protein [Azospirillaceae bacterium]